MNLAQRLANSQRRKDQRPNVELAVELADERDAAALAELFRLLDSGPRRQCHDAMQVIFEVAKREPDLLLPHFDDLLDQLVSRDNRLLWGSIFALSALVELAPEALMQNLALILDAAERSTVIARDKAMLILAGLAGDARYRTAVVPLMLRHVEAAATNQFPTYAERAAARLLPTEMPDLIRLIEAHAELAEYPAKQRRMDKLIQRMHAAIG